MNLREALHRRIDPMALARLLWPKVTFYDKQREIIYSIVNNYQTVVPAGNMLGKDFVAGFLALTFFLTRGFYGTGTCRVVTTSVEDRHLKVLWGEIDRYIRTSKYPLTADKGGPLIYNHREVRRVVGGAEDKYDYLIGMTADKPESLSGHHAERTLALIDEASGVAQEVDDHMSEWAKKKLVIGNPHPCNNAFRKAVKKGDVLALDGGSGYYTKIIKIKAEDSPNVQYATAELRAGKTVSHTRLVPGVLTYAEYLIRRRELDPVQQCIKLDAEFYEGAEVLLYPPTWLDRAERRARKLPKTRVAKALGVDPAQGGDNTSFCVVDELGVIRLKSLKTPDTSVITGEIKKLMHEFSLRPDQVCLDAGGGKEHADRLRREGFKVRTVGFGESLMMDPKRGMRQMEERVENREERYTYVNRRAEMYYRLRLALDPEGDAYLSERETFAIPASVFYSLEAIGRANLRSQMAPIPLETDDVGRIKLRSKTKKPGSKEKSLVDIIGHSPDELDSLVIALHVMSHKSRRSMAGAA